MRPRQVVQTFLNYWPATGPVQRELILGTIGAYRRPIDSRPALIEDVRGQERAFALDIHGFQFIKHVSQHVASFEEASVKRYMYPEAEDILKNVTGATRAHVFSHITRTAPYERVEAMADSADPDTKATSVMVPARHVHVDQSEPGALEVVKDNMTALEAERLFKTRWAIVNIWRPLKVVPRDPLAVSDARSFHDDDLLEIYGRVPGREKNKDYDGATKGSGFGMLYGKYAPGQKWYYMSDMKPDEVVLIKCYDSKDDGQTARRTPHTAFVDPRTQGVQEARESLELRCLVFFEDQPLA
ncbi:GA4 desaturase family protein [Aspergillus bombycis]|uniref:GA4 desaturase family protein n=1 Tax=Aspergillus bombycis TaxID=109264 RepID=A0A1F8A0Z1_9EURO|nr:GA4 desaturase family protein [Aspergillus bombycis]OGM45386.1 GA4 desaturase family protein [Aspergillus bombycis]